LHSWLFVGPALAGMEHGIPPKGGITNKLLAIYPMVLAAVALIGAVSYGNLRIYKANLATSLSQSGEIDVALIQGSRDTTFSAADDPRQTLAEYRRLTAEAVDKHPEIDLIVWPESMHTVPWVEYTWPVAHSPPGWPTDEQELKATLAYSQAASREHIQWIARQFGKAAVVGTAAIEIDATAIRRFNRAVWTSETGDVAGHYDKMHPVMFGEYVPLGNFFPWLYRLTPMGNGLESGQQPLSISVGDVRLSPSICYENTVPHLLRRQIRRLKDQRLDPHALITMSNDGWFWGSSELDFHLACGVFRAVEFRRPMLVAANTGFSANITSTGKIQEKGPRRATGVVIGKVSAADPPESFYLAYGDWLGISCLLACMLAGFRLRWGGGNSDTIG